MQNSDLLEHDVKALNNGVELFCSSAVVDDGRQPPNFDKSQVFYMALLVYNKYGILQNDKIHLRERIYQLLPGKHVCIFS